MSTIVEGTTITHTRGDTLLLPVEIYQNIGPDPEGEPVWAPYIPQPGETVRFALKSARMTTGNREYVDQEPLILVDIPINTLILRLDPEDTKDLSFGTYKYDIEITQLGGIVTTFITEADFKLTPEVH